MLARIFQRGLSGAQQNFLGSIFPNRKLSNEYSPHLPGGGLKKVAGCFKEETYFKLNDLKLLLKMREQTLRGAGYDTTEVNNVIQELNEIDHLVTHHNQNLMNKHKNCMEELYFLNEETMNLRRLEKKMHAELEQKLLEQQKLESTRRAAEQLANKIEVLPTMRNMRYKQ